MNLALHFNTCRIYPSGREGLSQLLLHWGMSNILPFFPPLPSLPRTNGSGPTAPLPGLGKILPSAKAAFGL